MLVAHASRLAEQTCGACFGWRWQNQLSDPGSPGLNYELSNVELVCKAKNLVLPNLLKNM